MKKPKNTLTGASIIASAIAAAECAKQHVNENPETELREQTGAAEQRGDQNTDPAGQSGQVKNESADPDAAGSSEAAESSAASSEAAVSSVESSEAAVSSVEPLIDDYSPSANWNVEEYAPPGMYNLSFYPCKILS